MELHVIRSLCQETTRWYFSHLDPFASHLDNVHNYLRGPVLAVTLRTLYPSPLVVVGEEEKAELLVMEAIKELKMQHLSTETDATTLQSSSIISKTTTCTTTPTSKDWRDFLKDSSISSEDEGTGLWNKKDQENYNALDRRTKARMEAFLQGCALAIPDESHHHSNNRGDGTNCKNDSHDKHNNKSNHHYFGTKAPEDEVNLLTAGLSGFREAGSSSSSTRSSSGGSKSGKFTSPMSSPVLKSFSVNGSSLLRQISSGSSSALKKHCQICEDELMVRLELYLRMLSRVYSSGQECVLGMESLKMLKARAKILVGSFVQTVGCVQRQSPVLTELLSCLSQELLAVETLGEGLIKVMKRVVVEYEHQTSFASLAFLSSPEATAENRLTPMILSYLKYLQSNAENLVGEAELELWLCEVIHPQLRRTFKTIEFRSIGHLLEVCQHYRSDLQHIELVSSLCCNSIRPAGPVIADDSLPQQQHLSSHDSQALRQAIRDLQREIITVNGHVLPPVTSRKDLVYLLSQTLNSRALTSEPPGRRRRHHHKSNSRDYDVRRAESCPSIVSLDKFYHNHHASDSDDWSSSSGNEGDTDGSVNSQTGSRRVMNHGSDDKRRHRKRNFHLSTIDALTRRLLIAGSRTGMGGDAFFVVRDLFGGDEVEVVPAKQLPPAPTSGGRMARHGTIEIVVRLASVTIKCHGTFDVYPKSLVGHCEPLIQLHTTMTETIGLREVRAHDSSSDDYDVGGGGKLDDCHDDNNNNGDDDEERYSVLLVQERMTTTSGRRILSIRPALYERVEVWNTPS